MNLKDILPLFLKGFAMGAANVIPGVSGGTIAFITGIYERFINALKSFDLEALNLLRKGQIKSLLEHVDFFFLLPLFIGIGVSGVSLAKLLEYLLMNHETLTMSFFFGLIVASVYLVGKEAEKWDATFILLLAIGAAGAGAVALLNPGAESDNPFYLFICGVVAICSMVLPGLSGSYMLLIMGNYFLILKAVNQRDFLTIGLVGLGAAIGLVSFARLLSYVFKKFRNQTIGLLTGFVFGSLAIIWPWKETNYVEELGKKKAIGYEWLMPELNGEFWMSVALMLVGVACVILVERLGTAKQN